MKKIVLKVNGKRLEFNPPRAIFVKIAKRLSASPIDDVFYAEEVAAKWGFGICSVRFFSKDKRFAHYVHQGENKIYHFGNPRAIVALKQFLAENGK